MSLADISLARDVLGYAPRVGFEQGLEQTLDWYLGGASSGTPSQREVAVP